MAQVFKTGTALSSALTKRNRAGQQQPYVPSGHGDESGEYRDNAYNVVEIGPQIQGKEPAIEDKSDTKEPTTPQAPIKQQDSNESFYKGNGRNVLNDALSKRLRKSPNSTILMESIANADDELSGVIGTFYDENPQVALKLGKNLSSAYKVKTWQTWEEYHSTYEVAIGQGVFYGSDSYSKGGVFFHESSHALDSSFINSTGHMDDWSYAYTSEKYGMTLSQKIQQEISSHSSEYKQIKEQIKQEKLDIRTKIFTPEMAQEREQLNASVKEARRAFDNDATLNELISERRHYLDKLTEMYPEIMNMKRRGDLDQLREYINEYESNRKTVVEIGNKIESYKNEFYQKNYPEFEKINARLLELNDIDRKAYDKSISEIHIKYGDLSDMFDASGPGELCGMGHSSNYWNQRHIGNEAFAEISSAKATNPASYNLLKKFIPESLEIYDEIIQKIKSKKSLYYKK